MLLFTVGRRMRHISLPWTADSIARLLHANTCVLWRRSFYRRDYIVLIGTQ